jgi:hypothetical protein
MPEEAVVGADKAIDYKCTEYQNYLYNSLSEYPNHHWK